MSQVFNAKGSCVCTDQQPSAGLGCPQATEGARGCRGSCWICSPPDCHPRHLHHTWAPRTGATTATLEPEPERTKASSSSEPPASARAPRTQHLAARRAEPEQSGTEKATTAFCSTQRRCLPHCCSLSLIAKQLLTFPFILSFPEMAGCLRKMSRGKQDKQLPPRGLG